MAHGERSVFVVPATQMRVEAAAQAAAAGRRVRDCLLDPPGKAAQVELEVELLGLVQVRT